MRHLIVCCDGTWNTIDQRSEGVPTPTNVVRLYNALDKVGADGATEQRSYYHPGVGTEPGLVDRIAGGATGAGLNKNIMSAYQWLCWHYQDGDRIFMFGFSRGAYTVRSLAGFLGHCGLLKVKDVPGKPDLTPTQVWSRIGDLFQRCYRDRSSAGDGDGQKWLRHQAGGSDDIPIYMVGVWDTVGALGIPNDLALLNLLDATDEHAFHDTSLSNAIEHARHAVALDERRETFLPTLWAAPKDRPDDHTFEQVWFPGVHSDVGGGYPETGLSDGALKWMMDEADALGLGFEGGMRAQVKPNPADVLHDSYTGVFAQLPSRPRPAPDLDEAGQPLHASVTTRRQTPPITDSPYRLTVARLNAHESHEFTVYAYDPWNATGLHLEKGVTYHFEASGEWLDRDIKCGPDGTHEGHFRPSEAMRLIGSALGAAETLFKRITGNTEADFQMTRRHERIGGARVPWFCLVGAIANGRGADQDGKVPPHETFRIGAGCTYRPKDSGYLYAYANDAWNFYGNNRGSVHLVISRR